jgi:hypothetical protein
MEKKRITVHLSVQQAGRLRLLSRKHRLAETGYVEKLITERAELITEEPGTRQWERAVAALRRAARIEAASVRPSLWPALDVLVGRALTDRLAVADLAGPWRALTEQEQARLSLAGRWPVAVAGLEFGTQERAFTLDAALVTKLRTAAWRVSEPVLNELADKELTGPTAGLSDRQLAERNRLAELLYPASRIVREAVDQHWPLPQDTAPETLA